MDSLLEPISKKSNRSWRRSETVQNAHILRKFGIELEIEGKDLLTIAREAQEIVYN